MSDDVAAQEGSGAEFPTAEVSRAGPTLLRELRRHPSRFWLLTLVCLIVAAVLLTSGMRARGTRITVRFEQGYGIKPGDLVRHRGIDVGQVSAVELNDELSGVNVVIDLQPAAGRLAREGSRFWIARPQVSLSRITGLETVVGAKYVGVIADGPPDAPRKLTFDGDEAPLTMLESNVDIRIRFKNGHGLAVGDALKHRGIVVGEVTAVELSEDLAGVNVGVRLVETAQRLARVGSQFWVERPKVSLTGVRGIETIVGGRYVAVVPGPDDAERLDVFDGLEEPPSALEREEGNLEIILESKLREGIESGSPLTYRGMQIGHIVSVGLSPDARRIELRASIRPAYRQLVREDSKFWSISGFKADWGVGGLQFSAGTLATIAAGGVAMASPDPPGKPAREGSRFDLDEEPDGWLDWTPPIAIGASLLPAGATLPQPVRVAMQWRERTLGISHREQAAGWALPLEGGRLLGPRNLLSPPAAATEGRAALQFEGFEIEIRSDDAEAGGNLAVRTVSPTAAELPSGWPAARVRIADAPEDCLIVSGSHETVLSLPASRIQQSDGGWQIDRSFTLTKDAHGACVVAVRDGRLVGMILIEKGEPRVAFPPEFN